MGELIDLISKIGLGDTASRSKDILGRVYEYFLGQFAEKEGKGGGEFYTPQSVVKMLVKMIEPYRGRIYDPCCGSGGMFVQSEKFVEAHGGNKGDIAIYGQESNPTTRRLCLMNLAIRGIDSNIGDRQADSFTNDLHKDLKADYILGTLDDKIELNQQINHTLEAIARALFKSWFIDFDPVRAKIDGRQPAGMDAETAALFPDEFEDSAGKIPNGWKTVPLSEVIEVNPRRSLTQGKLAPYLDMQNMPTQGHRPNGWIYREFSSGTKFIQGDTLLARITPCLENGKTAFIDFLPEGEVGWGSTEYIILRPKPPL
nr:N-6 DNA methylase [Nostoc flagelliforme]